MRTRLSLKFSAKRVDKQPPTVTSGCIEPVGIRYPIILYDYREDREYCNQLFKIEEQLEGLLYEESYRERLERSKPILDAYFARVDFQEKRALSQSYFGKAIMYSQKQREKLKNFLLDRQLELSNNRVERSAKSFVIGRKTSSSNKQRDNLQ